MHEFDFVGLQTIPEWVRSCGGRVFVDAAGDVWCVSERRTSPEGDATSLVFMAQHAARRVRVFPRNWASLSDAELEAISWRR
jgi:hypothetical protein